MADHRAEGPAKVRPLRTAPRGTHRGVSASVSVVKVGVLGALATATIGVPLASAATSPDLGGADAASRLGVESPAPAADTTASSQQEKPEPVALEPVSTTVRSDQGAALTVAAGAGQAPVTGSDGQKAAQPAAAPVASSTGWSLPADGPVTSPFGWRIHPTLGYRKFHDGTDFGAMCGSPAKAAAAGVVDEVSFNSASGNRVFVKHADGTRTGYFHLEHATVAVGQTVAQGQEVGAVGSTGRSTGCHLHFALVEKSGAYADPMSLFR